jgi:formyltetrahydrofolate synthetase
VVGLSKDGAPITLDALGVAGAVTVLMKDALHPNLMQTLEGQPAFVHAGPFANIAHGNSSIIADRLALRLADVVVTEAGFAAELGAEKFFDIKCRLGGFDPAGAVVVATTRALKLHGMENLARHVEIVHRFGLPAIVAVNAFADDTPDRLADAVAAARVAGADSAHIARHVADGGEGTEALAAAVATICRRPKGMAALYPDDLPLREKIERIATQVYGADGIDLCDEAISGLARLEAEGRGRLPICIAKTPLSISHDPKRGGMPTGWRLPIRRVRLFAGAGFVTAYAGAIQTLPGLPQVPAASRIDLEPDGTITGL